MALGALPAVMVLYSRRKMPESPRYLTMVQGQGNIAASQINDYSDGTLKADGTGVPAKLSFSQFITNPKYLVTLIGTAGTWFVFDYAYYGNSVSAPLIVKQVLGKHATITQSLALNLIIFTVAAVPGYYLAAHLMDRIGHRRLQLIGFPIMGLMFLLTGVITAIVPFLILFGLNYYFAEFGPNTTTFVLSAECIPTSARTTGHGISAGIAKLGAFIGVYLFPHISKAFGIGGALEFSAGMALLGTLLTLLIPETNQKSLEEISGDHEIIPRFESQLR